MVKAPAFWVTVVLAVGAVIGGVCWGKYQYDLPKFQNVTMELGEELPPLEAFFTEYARPEKAAMVTDRSAIDLSQAGEQTLTFSQGRKVEAVTLTVQDTTAPELTVRDVVATAADKLTVEDFVVSCTDLSPVTVELARPLGTPEHYGTVDVEVVAQDALGNSTSRHCTVSYQWMYPTATLELGDTLTRKDVLLDYVLDYELVEQADLDQISQSPVGAYTLVSHDGDATATCLVTVVDTKGPVVELQEVSVYVGESVKLEDFLVRVTDFSQVAGVNLSGEPDTSQPGDFQVVVQATDTYGNETLTETVLHVKADDIPPTIYGLGTMYVAKYAQPDYEDGVWAEDDRDGRVGFTYSAAGVDTSKAGSYFVTYTATDKKGNTGSYRRKVVVDHDAQDTAALVASIANTLSSDPEAIRNYVRNSIYYNHDWGGDDPIWYGFNQRWGNCYVHNRCLQALLNYKGYNTKLIWVTDKSHYWLVIELGGVWRHIDATPGRYHERYSLMTDEQRYETLSGRDWNRDMWPKCE